MRARYYSAFLGRFLSTDPMLPDDATGGNFNRYAYAYNNPYKFTDPDGLCPMGCPDDITDPVTIEESADILGAVAGAIESLDEALAPLGPEGGVEFHAAAAPIAGVLREAAAGVEAVGDVAKISGAAQVTREAGKETMHAATSARIAGEQAARLDAESVHLNQTIRTATGKAVPSSLRPDVQTVRTDGKVDVHEVLSPGQDAGASAAKYNNALGNRAGIIKCVPQDKC